MKRWVGWILLAICLYVAFVGYQNSQQWPLTEDLARSVACDVAGGCVLSSQSPREVRTDVTQRRYAWGSNKGPLHVVCRREYVFAGDWSCIPHLGGFPDS